MGLFDIFKIKWSGKEIGPDERRKIFWYLKRRSSYTAWKREADAFDRFADIFERQVIEEPFPPAQISVCGTDWECRYPEVLKAQVLYEKALHQLSHGNRAIFLCNSPGVLREARSMAHRWHSELVNHGPHGDHFFDGKYVPAMTAALQGFFECLDDTGYFQSALLRRRAPHFWGSWMKNDLRRACHLDVYPEVPEPGEEISIRSGENTPVFGIYEPQTKDGCMNYLLPGMPAPLLAYGDEPGQMVSVQWRLIWEDTRYRDGTIPAEESAYFKPQGSPAQVARSPNPASHGQTSRHIPHDG